MHRHKWSRWEDVGVIATRCYGGGAIVQTRVCEKCGKRKLRKTNSVSATQANQVAQILLTLFMKSDKKPS